MRKLLITILIVVCAYTPSASAQVAPEKRKEIEKMLRLTGMEKIMTQIMGQMLSTFKQQMPNVPSDFWDRFQQKMDTHELVEKVIPVYDKYYTIDDLKAVNAFYESAAGQKVLASMPQVTQECMKIGQEYGERIAKEAVSEAEKESKKK